MLHCSCGYTCGTRKALDRHFTKIADVATKGSGGSGAHEQVPEPPTPVSARLRPPKDFGDDEVSSVSASLASTSVSLSVASTPRTTALPSLSGTASPRYASPFAANTAVARDVDLPAVRSVPRPVVQEVQSRPTGPPWAQLLVVRHAQSANRKRAASEAASPDPGISELGIRQAEAVGRKLGGLFAGRRPLIISSPMLRCLLTIRPAVKHLSLSGPLCLCHASCYEFGCAGAKFPGTPEDEITERFPEFQPVCFNDQGCWDYRGSNVKESFDECRERGIRVARWLHEEGPAAIAEAGAGGGSPSEPPTLILCIHQTFADLLCHVLLDGTADRWEYGDPKYKLSNAAITEVFLYPNGRAISRDRNQDGHLWGC